MLRQQTIRKIEYQRQLLPMLHYMATLPITDTRHINISSNVLRALDSESYYFVNQWIKAGRRITDTSRSRYSFIAADVLSAHHYLKLLHQVKSFYKSVNGNVRAYLLTVNPKKLRYNEVSKLNRLIGRMLKRDANVALFQKEVENTYYHASNNIHIHYLVFSTESLNQQKILRSVKRYGRRATNSITHAKIEAANNLKGAVSYVTKQYGLPLPLKDNQFERFAKLPKSKQMQLLADDINDSKGVERHRLYINSNNTAASSWHRKLTDKNYCLKHDVLVKPYRNAKLTSENCRTTVFGVAFNKIYSNAHKRSSKHHYSEHEQLMQLYHHNIYYRDEIKSIQTKLF